MRRFCVLTALLCSVAIIFVIGDRTDDDLDIGDPCKITRRYNEPGLCALITSCSSVSVSKTTEKPTICGFRGLEPIVCCPFTVDALPFVTDGQRSDEDSYPVKKHYDQQLRISAKKCLEYHRTVHANITIERVNGMTVEHRETVCPSMGYAVPIGGPETKLWDYPHTALIGYASISHQIKITMSWACGGSLISDQYVLTAAHCLNRNYRGPPSAVRFGVDLNLPYPTAAIDYDVHTSIAHPDYSKPPISYNDIGLIRLSQRVQLTKYRRPICLPTSEKDDTESSAVATGWGPISGNNNNNNKQRGSLAASKAKPKDVLLEIEVEQETFIACNASFGELTEMTVGVDKRTQLCVASYAEATGTCRSDWGGPLQTYYSDSYQPCLRKLIGITSFGETCGAADSLAVFTRVFPYLQWIEANVWPDAV